MDVGARAVSGARFEHDRIRLPARALTIAVGIGLLCIVARYTYEAYALPKPLNPVDVGAGGFPKLIAVTTLAALGMLLAANMFIPAAKAEDDQVVVRRPWFVLLASIALVGQAVAFEVLGPVICVGLFALLIMAAAGERRLLHLAGVPAALSLGIYVIFALVLGVHFP